MGGWLPGYLFESKFFIEPDDGPKAGVAFQKHTAGTRRPGLFDGGLAQEKADGFTLGGRRHGHLGQLVSMRSVLFEQGTHTYRLVVQDRDEDEPAFFEDMFFGFSRALRSGSFISKCVVIHSLFSL